jgi:hypothetical protein
MEISTEPLDLTLQLPRDVYYQAIHTLSTSLPPPITDSPEDLVRRDNAAIAAVAAMLPVTADEARIAAQFVAADAQAMDSLRLARRYHGDPNLILKCSAQSASMMRQARAARTLLLRVQAERRKLEADSTATDKAAWTEHCAIGLMALALGRDPPAAMEEPPPPPAPLLPPEEPVPDPIAEAEQYAIIYPQRAARIRALGGLPQPLDFGPPEPYLVQAIITGNSPALRALDTRATA